MAVYDSIAAWYGETQVVSSPVHALVIPALLDLCAPLEGQSVLDLACGEGALARLVAAAGACATGVDISHALLEAARAVEGESPLGIRYVSDDAQELSALCDRAFDTVICCLALMDIPDLGAVLTAVHRVLKPGGRFVFAITHPCFQTPDSRWTGKAGGTVRREVRAYFEEGLWFSGNPHGVRGKVGAYHRTLTTYISALCENGFVIDRFCEPRPADPVAARVPGYDEAPVALVVRCLKGDHNRG